MKNNKERVSLLPIFIFALISLIYALPFVYTFSDWGQNDWDQFLFWNAVPKLTILKYHQFPLWNPYGNGGNVLLAHPHSSFLSPFYSAVLLLGPIRGLKIEIIAHLFIGMLGMYFIARHFRMNRISSYVPGIIFMLSPIYTLHAAEGHASWLAMAFFPWLFLFYEKGLKNGRFIVGGILALSLMLLGGSVDVLHISVTFLFIYSLFKSIELKSLRAFAVFIFIVTGAAFLSALKTVPMLEFLQQYSRITVENSGISLRVLAKMLLGRAQALYITAMPMTEKRWAWHEYGSYVGILPLILAGIGVTVKGKKFWPLALSGAACLLIAMGSGSPFNLWRILHSLPIYASQHVPSRYILGFIFCVALLCGMGMSRLEGSAPVIKQKIWRFGLRAGLLAGAVFLFIDLYSVDLPILRRAFGNPPLCLERHEDFRQRHADLEIPGQKNGNAMYPVFLSNSGIINSYEVIAIKKGDLKTTLDADYRGEAYLAERNGDISLAHFSPNKLVLDVFARKEDRVVLNQNYYTGWQVTDNGEKTRAVAYKGLVSAFVTPGYHKITFYYLPASFIIGSFMSAGFALFLAYYYRRNA